MDGFTLIDGIVAAVIILSAILAYARGFVRESLAIVGWVGAAVLAFLFAGTVRPMIAQVPFLDKFLGDSCELATIAAFAVVFAVALVLFSIITPLFSSVVQRSALGGVDQGMGFLFGVARGILLVAIALIVYDRVMPGQKVADGRQFTLGTGFPAPQRADGPADPRRMRRAGSCRAMNSWCVPAARPAPRSPPRSPPLRPTEVTSPAPCGKHPRLTRSGA